MNYICTYEDNDCLAYCNGRCKNEDEICFYRVEEFTNADHMRSLSDEELATDILEWIVSNDNASDEDGLKQFILNYLKQPYDGK